MVLVKTAMMVLVSSLQAVCFSPNLLVQSPSKPQTIHMNDDTDTGKLLIRQNQQHGRGLTAMLSSRSVNDDGGGFHYDQEPRGQSFISQVSQKDLWERRQRRVTIPM